MLASQSQVNGHSRQAADRLLARLEEPGTAEALNQLLDHAELLAFSASALDGFIRRSDVIAENVAASMSDLRKMGAENAELGQLLERLPHMTRTAVQLSRLVDNPEFQKSLDILSKPETIAGLNRLLTIAPQLTQIVEKLQPFITSSEFDALLQSGVFHTDTVRLIGNAGDDFVNSYEDSRRTRASFGPLKLFRALFDSDIKRAVGLFMLFLKRFGQSLLR